MKFIIFKVNSGSSLKKRRSDDMGIEKVLSFLFICTFALLIIAQSALIGPSIKTSAGKTIGLEGKPLGMEEYLYKEGKIGLELLNSEPDENVKVLVNGNEAAAFNNSFVSITVRDGDIVEIDGSSARQAAEVAIVSKSDNISESCAGKKLKIDSGVKFLTQIIID